MMVLYSGVCSIAIGKLFMAGFIPGIVIAIGYMIVNILYARTHDIRREPFAGWKKLGHDTVVALPALVMPIIIIGGILSGIFTATESGAIACAYCIIYGLIRKRLTMDYMKKCFMDAVHSSATTMIIIGFACMFGALATNYNLAKIIQSAASSFASSPQMVLVFISVVLYIAGMFIDSNAVMFMLIPIFAPLIDTYHYDPLYFAIVMILALVMGGISPPVGLVMYIASAITGTDLGKVVKYIFRFIVINYAAVILVIFVPQIALWLPGRM
jgi:C4-dicarboxylate transporter DctM subunit